MAKKPALLTLKLDDRTLAEFHVAAKVFRARSTASFLHQYVVGQINEAKRMVDLAEFERLVTEQLRLMMERREVKSASSKKIVPDEFKGESGLPGIPSVAIKLTNDQDRKENTG